MKDRIVALGKALLSLLYPITCQICHKRLTQNKGLCANCASKIHKNSFGVAACAYDGVLKRAIWLFKYKGVFSLLNTFSDLILEFVARNIDMKKIDTIIPVPLHPVKFRQRGFNQAHLLSLSIAKRFNVPVSANNLVKIRPTVPQSNLNRNQRIKNLIDAFLVKRADLLKGKRVLLIDDVYTTGTTISKAAQALNRSGASHIEVVTLAKGA